MPSASASVPAPGRSPTAPPLALAQARALVLAAARPLAPEQVPLRAALARVLAAEIVSDLALPPFDNSAMDGFAVRARDTLGARPGQAVRLRLAGESRAGRPCEHALDPRAAIAISTGAALPAGADAVVRLEDCSCHDGAVEIQAEVAPGRDVRRRGEDIQPGQAVLARGTPLGPAELGVLAALGRASVPCARRPTVRILTTGDELLPAADPLRPGTVHDTSAHTIPALARCAGAQVLDVAHAPDRPQALEAAVRQCLRADVAVICGGISVGAHDHVKDALAACGVQRGFAGVALKPGKPAWFGTHGHTLAFGLPGNPVSSIACFTLFVVPALRALGGCAPALQTRIATLAHDVEKPRSLTQALACRLSLGADRPLATPTGPQGSHILTAMLGADAFALLPPGVARVRAGEAVEIELIELG